ncbi:hypothetical protein, partial [Pseudomonas viridiflava]|uniref:hypothetical protein n=1 Tax=Pseudomonas viridiflava TaxID=33069 RepID=UPI0019D253DC
MSITLKHELFNQSPRLAEVRDATRCLLKISRSAGQVTLSRYPDTTSSSNFKLILKNSRVTAIELPVGKGW